METFGPEEGDWELTLGGGGSNDRDFEAGGFQANGSIGYFFTDAFELVLRQGYQFSEGASSEWSGSTRGALDYHFDMGRLRPFVGGNFGGSYGRGRVDTWGAGLEAGLKYYVKPKTFLFALGEYQWAFNDFDRADNNFDEGAFIYSLGIGFNF